MSEFESAQLQARMRALVEEHRQTRAPTSDADARVWSRVQHSMLAAPVAASTAAVASEAAAKAAVPQAAVETACGVASAGTTATAAGGLGKGLWASLAWSLVGAGGVTTAVIVSAQLQGEPDGSAVPQDVDVSSVSEPVEGGRDRSVVDPPQGLDRPRAFDVETATSPLRPSIESVRDIRGSVPMGEAGEMDGVEHRSHRGEQTDVADEAQVEVAELPSAKVPEVRVRNSPRSKASRRAKSRARSKSAHGLNGAETRGRSSTGDALKKHPGETASMPQQLHDLAELDRAVRAGESARALRLVGAFERRYPGSALQQEVDALKLLAQCQDQEASGPSRSRAQARAKRRLKRWPGSKFAARLRATCGVGDTQ